VTGTTTITSVAGSTTGTLVNVACFVSTGTTGSPSATLDVTLDGIHKTSYTLYSASNAWPNTLAAFATRLTTSYSPGTQGNDTFVLPFNVAYTNGLTVAVHVTAAGTAGTPYCTVMHT